MVAPRHVVSMLLLALSAFAADQVTLPMGKIEGLGKQPNGVRPFLGIPFAEAPVGNLRWAPPTPVKPRKEVIEAKRFGPRCMQLPLFGDMNFRSNGMSEDCLYLNIWTPAKSANAKLPVLLYYFGGGFQAGDGSEPRYEGASMAARGIVAISVNYRLGILGQMAHPDLSKESPAHASGNYGYLDQSAALRWVHENIAAFGGDPNNITIAGESAGSSSVSAQMASPLSRNLIAGAIGESGSIIGGNSPVPLAEAEAIGTKFGASIGADSIAALRAIPADKLYEAVAKPGVARFPATIDGLFFTEQPLATYAAGRQAKVPLLAGWNSMESGPRTVLGQDPATVAGFKAAVERLYKEHAPKVLALYNPKTDAEVEQAATDLAGDRFIAFSTWRWTDIHASTSGQPVYRYYYSRPRPRMRPEMGNAVAGLAGGVIRQAGPPQPPAPPAKGAVHSAEIEYAMGNLDSNKVYAWEPEDFKVSSIIQTYFETFIKSKKPSGKGLPAWPPISAKDIPVMHIDVNTRVEPDHHRARYLLQEELAPNKR